MAKRIVIGGSKSGVGKTTVALALMAAYNARDYKVQPFKVGPDYIDPGFHNLAAGTPSYNLDSYFLQGLALRERFINKSKTGDISVIEGVMGLFDGKGKEMTGSTAEIAKKLKAPVILVIDAAKMGQSGAALVYGYKNFDPDLNLKGVIINNVGSSRHYQILKEVLESEPVKVDLLGYLPRIEDLELPERHLGLVPVQES
ncbi:MAG: cobyrinate a,c-diamide synthase, partial [Bacillota bacterium]